MVTLTLPVYHAPLPMAHCINLCFVNIALSHAMIDVTSLLIQATK